MKKILLICTCIIAISAISKAQNKEGERIKVIHFFLTDFYDKSASAQLLIDNYMYLEPTQNPDTIRLNRMSIDTLANTVRILTKSKYNHEKVQIIPYPKLIAIDKPAFGGNGEDIYAIKVENQIIMYLYFRQNRIWSFYHFQKGKGTAGESAFFLIF